ncbi:MAG TPA: hypothetical protein PKZ36_00305 [Candidatus Paceibacterota bacterium]|nr:hypothetical protein [Candidatus Paceibacterota bacterium]HPT17844.1 hypothetical protein [Candidatus Paceibacterota bacterium]
MIDINSQKKESIISDKASFMIGLAAVILAIFPFKDKLDSIKLNIFGYDLTIFSLALIFLGLLLFSSYLYGLNNIRYNSEIFTNKWFGWSKYIEVLAHIVYTLAFIFPILVIMSWILTEIIPIFILVSKVGSESIKSTTEIISGSFSIITALISVVLSFSLFRKKEKSEIENLSNDQKIYIGSAKRNYSIGDYRLTILNLFQAVILSLKSNLIPHIGLNINRVPPSVILNVAEQRKLITVEEKQIIRDLMGLRNQVAHNLNSFHTTKEQVKKLEDRIISIIAKQRNIYTNSKNK